MSDDSSSYYEFMKEQFPYLADEIVETGKRTTDFLLENISEDQGIESLAKLTSAIMTIEYGINEMVNLRNSSPSLLRIYEVGVSHRLFVNAKTYLLLYNLKEEVDGLSVEMPRRLEQINGLDTDLVLSLYNRVIYNDKFKYITSRIGKSLAKAFPDWLEMNNLRVVPVLGELLISRADSDNLVMNMLVESHLANLFSIWLQRRLF